MFSPAQSKVKQRFETLEPDWITLKPAIEQDWNPCLMTILYDYGIGLVSISPDGRYPASTDSNGCMICIRDAATGSIMHNIVMDDPLTEINRAYSLAFSHDKHTLASGHEDGTIRIWDPIAGRCLQVLQGHDKAVNSVYFAPKSGLLASGSDDKTLRIWDVDAGECKRTLQCDDPVGAVAFSPDGKQLAYGSVSEDGDTTVQVWDATTNKCTHLVRVGGDWNLAWGRKISFSHDNNLLAFDTDNEVQIWNVTEHKYIKLPIELQNVVFLNDNHLATTAGGGRDTIEIWDTTTLKCLRTYAGHSDFISALAYSSNYLVSVSNDCTIRIWDAFATRAKHTHQTSHHLSTINTLSFSYDGHHLVSGSYDSNVKVWEVSTGRCVNTLKGHADRIWEAHFSRDGQWIASSDGCDLRVWEAATGNCVHIVKVPDGFIESTAFSSDSRHLAVACLIELTPPHTYDIQVWDVVQGMRIQTLQAAGDEVDHDALVFSEDGRYLAASSSRVTHIWDTITFPYEMAQTLKHDFCHRQPIFLNNSRYVARFAGESVVIWDINQGQPIHTIDTPDLDMGSLSFDTRRLSFEMRCLSFDENNFRVTEHGKVSICVRLPFSQGGTVDFQNPNGADNSLQDALPFEELLCPGYGLSPDLEWILRDGEKAIWLPLEYRVDCYRVLGRTIALGGIGGHVLFLTLSESC